MGHDLNIYPLRIDEEKLGEQPKDIIPDLVHFNVHLGKIRSGKSLLMANHYISNRFYGDDYDVKIIISPTIAHDQQMAPLREHFDFIFEDYSEALIDELMEMIENDQVDNRYLLVLDDCMGDRNFVMKRTGKQDALSSLITKFRHIGSKNLGTEGRLAICLSCQRYKFLTSTIRQNIQGFYVMGSFPESELKKIAEDYSFIGGSEQKFLEIFKESRKDPFDFLYINVPKLEAWRSYKERLWSHDEEFAKNQLLREAEEDAKNLNKNKKDNQEE
jgi:hypothetical protein